MWSEGSVRNRKKVSDVSASYIGYALWDAETSGINTMYEVLIPESSGLNNADVVLSPEALNFNIAFVLLKFKIIYYLERYANLHP